MNQTLLALGALVGAILLAMSMRDGVARHERSGMEAQVDLASAELAVRALDRLAALPISHGDPPASPLALDNLRSVDQANGLTQTISVGMSTSTVDLVLAVAVTPVKKQGLQFQPTTEATPYRRATVRVTGPLEAEVEFERLFASGEPTP